MNIFHYQNTGLVNVTCFLEQVILLEGTSLLLLYYSCYAWNGCGLGGGVGNPPIGRSVAQLQVSALCMLKCPCVGKILNPSVWESAKWMNVALSTEQKSVV